MSLGNNKKWWTVQFPLNKPTNKGTKEHRNKGTKEQRNNEGTKEERKKGTKGHKTFHHQPPTQHFHTHPQSGLVSNDSKDNLELHTMSRGIKFQRFCSEKCQSLKNFFDYVIPKTHTLKKNTQKNWQENAETEKPLKFSKLIFLKI